MHKPLNTSNKIKSVLILFCMLINIEPVFSQHWFNKTFNIYDDSARQVQHIGIDFLKINNQKVISTSISSSRFEIDTLNRYKKFFELSILNQNGEKIDSTRFFFKSETYSANVMFKYDSSICFVGGNILNYVENSNGSNGYDLMLMRVNLHGDSIWTRRYNLGNDDEYINKLLKDDQGNILIFGTKCITINSKNNCEYYFLKVDTNGNEIYRKYYSSTNLS